MSCAPTIVDRLLRELDRSFSGPTWHGPTLLETVGELDSEAAHTRVHPQLHTIAELTGHAAVWKEVVAGRLRGQTASPDNEAENFPSGAGPRDWSDCLARLRSAHVSLVEAVTEETQDTLDRTMPEGGGSAFDQILGVVQHDLYHAGQAVLILKAMSAETPPTANP